METEQLQAEAGQTEKMAPGAAPWRIVREWARRVGWKRPLWAALAGIAVVAGANFFVIRSARGRLFSQVETVPRRDVALVLGARGFYLTLRLQAAADLYKAGKVRHLLVSGDNHVSTYDEPTDMKRGLVARGIPESAITCDYAGFRTLDSVARAKKIFGQDRLIIVTQRFHAYRALALARGEGVDALAYCARDVPEAKDRVIPEAREVVARVLALVDLYVVRRQPRFLGQREEIKL